ncbi:beta propeller repeat protein [Halorussus salinisoli]|uniref:hypothetical protein n=1 Tax=Halorussus salinisoli TaxID=2558242 RepID=UPI0010C17CAA|nr:hypothetical protein [Halorussus salinisoli]
MPSVLVGTDDGVFRQRLDEHVSASVLDDASVHQLERGTATGEYYAATEDGLYRTDDGGRTWYRLDTHQRHFWFQYFREGIVHEGTYFTCAMDRSQHRFEDLDEGVVLRSGDGGNHPER